jgi:hypothetical protein
MSAPGLNLVDAPDFQETRAIKGRPKWPCRNLRAMILAWLVFLPLVVPLDSLELEYPFARVHLNATD